MMFVASTWSDTHVILLLHVRLISKQLVMFTNYTGHTVVAALCLRRLYIYDLAKRFNDLIKEAGMANGTPQ